MKKKKILKWKKKNIYKNKLKVKLEIQHKLKT